MSLYPAPGEIITVDGTDMHIYCVGEGSPTAIFEAGLGGNYMDWTLVQPAISEHTRTCAYDRSGMGYSDYLGTPLDSEATAQRLHQLLSAAEIAPPYILVGHSIGGIHVRSLYELYPEDVVAMVLVDSSHENQGQYLPQPPFFVNVLYNIAPTLAQVGIVRGLGLSQQNVADHLTPEQASQVSAMVNRTAFWQALNAENQMVTIDTNQER
ncbi:MAG: alpha/beta hydrolase, partial [Chloroflexota bacterium]